MSTQSHYANRAAAWRLRTRTLSAADGPLLMGIVNVTPDSFSDGGQWADPQRAVDHAMQLVDEGAHILDIGGESTRPGAAPVSESEEVRRTAPVIARLAELTDTPISIDTSKAAVAREAIAAGAEVINDVTGLAGDPAMAPLAAETGAGVCAMHMRGTPQTMQDDPRYDDVVQDVLDYLAGRRDALLAAGIERARICLDPGIGFGKTHQHNLALMQNCWRLHALGQPVLVGHSRKGLLAKLIGDPDRDRTAATVGAALALARQGVQVIRVHQIAPLQDALRTFTACGGLE
ncbi:Dihydropteroate synthase [Pirellulimonas nuda]|uniref:Dihydropteroate synthase n=1 Tax=Pirellulimonas nuda TaxID=2528009 RepID=A0A518D6D8_9BACT|nr:dihydropteroate synthase [Pirellulimonas nuda]QDU87038.1 Dihydropteroate synthase [Pirellulimonas nuda]